jgi:hypothetical protein
LESPPLREHFNVDAEARVPCRTQTEQSLVRDGSLALAIPLGE